MILNIQALRGLAAYLVVVFHLQDLALRAGAPKDVFVSGNAGVDIFFVISGVIMVLTTSRAGSTAGGFLKARITRLAPLYWAVTFVVFAVALATPSLLQSTTADPVQLLASLAFVPVQDAAGWVRPTVLVGWTLNYEMAFYGLFALGMLVPSRRAGLALVVAVLSLAAAVGFAARPQGVLAQFYTAPMILEFGAGIVLAVLIPRLPAGRAAAAAAVTLGLGAFAVMLASGWLWPGAERVLVWGIPAVVMVGAALVLERAGRVADSPLVQLIGAASYSIYLTHFFVTRLAIVAADRLGIHGPLALGLLGGFTLVVVAVAGIACYRLVELPLTGAARKGAERLRGGQLKPAVRSGLP